MTGKENQVEQNKAEIVKTPIDGEGWNEVTISVSANNKINMGNYESADRTVFISKKIRMDAAISMQNEHTLIEQEIRRLNSVAETENARIIALFCHECDPKMHADKIGIFTKVHKTFLKKAKIAFGLEVIEEVATLPAKGEKGITYIVKETGEMKRWTGTTFEAAT